MFLSIILYFNYNNNYIIGIHIFISVSYPFKANDMILSQLNNNCCSLNYCRIYYQRTNCSRAIFMNPKVISGYFTTAIFYMILSFP